MEQLIPFDIFKSLFPKAKPVIHSLLNQLLPIYEVNSLNRVSSFLAQCAHESMRFTKFSENLNYSAKALLKVFGKYFNYTSAALYEYRPEEIANIVYSNRMGNGSPESGDGWYFRGRGLIQLTGKDNYMKFAKYKNLHIDQCVGYLETFPGIVESALWFWKTNECNYYADIGDIYGQTKRINGGLNGIDDRLYMYDLVRNKLFDTLGTGKEFTLLSVHKKPRVKLGKIFYRDQFECSPIYCGCGTDFVDVLLIYVLEQFSNAINNRNIKIVSGTRCEKYNRIYGGINGSQHTKGKGADIEVPEDVEKGLSQMKSSDIINILKSIFGKAIYCYAMSDTMVHIDVRSPKNSKEKIQLTKSLTRTDFECNHCDYDIADYILVRFLYILEEKVKRPMSATCACRCKIHNRNVGGKDKSQHLLGKAADIQFLATKDFPTDMSSDEIMKIIKSLFGNMVWVYAINSRTVHMDVRGA